MDELVFKEDSVEYHWTFTGTSADTGKRVRIAGFEEWTIGADGLVVESLGINRCTTMRGAVTEALGFRTPWSGDPETRRLFREAVESAPLQRNRRSIAVGRRR